MRDHASGLGVVGNKASADVELDLHAVVILVVFVLEAPLWHVLQRPVMSLLTYHVAITPWAGMRGGRPQQGPPRLRVLA